MALASLLSSTSTPCSCFPLLLRTNPRLLHPLITFPLKLKPSPTRSSLAISASLTSLSSSLTTSTSTSSLFFARATSPTAPITVVGLAIARWLDLYTTLLMARVLLSWFPNISWDRQPFSAIRDLCDPYLALFRNIIPPLFGTLDLSPFLAFAVLHVLASILTATVR